MRGATPSRSPGRAPSAWPNAARAHGVYLAAGSVPELGPDGLIHDTALVLNAQGELVAWHRKAHLYPPTLEPSVFSSG